MPRCKFHKTKFEPKYFNQKYCLSDDECIKAFNESVKQTKRKEQTKKMKEATINWKNKLQTKVQEIARLIDYGLPCLATGNFGQMHGGHVYSKGAHPQMRFNLHNIHRQSAHSNTFSSHDGLMREKLSEEYGQDYADFVSNLRSYSVPKLSNKEYHEAYKIACEFANGIKNCSHLQSPKNRIILRSKANRHIGIYIDKQSYYPL